MWVAVFPFTYEIPLKFTLQVVGETVKLTVYAGDVAELTTMVTAEEFATL
jgi:hypothetical protein